MKVKNGAIEGRRYLGLITDSTVRFECFLGVNMRANKPSITGRLICLDEVEIDHVTSQQWNLCKILV